MCMVAVTTVTVTVLTLILHFSNPYHAVTGCNGLPCPPYENDYIYFHVLYAQSDHMLLACMSRSCTLIIVV